jgi:hypothetical protein
VERVVAELLLRLLALGDVLQLEDEVRLVVAPVPEARDVPERPDLPAAAPLVAHLHL